MSLELIYTSAPSGLKPGAKGFCTVLMTQGMPPGLVGRLEMLSAYRHMFPPQDPRANQNPTGYSHVKLKVSGQSISIISRVSAYGVDYSGRTNKFAHHVVLQPSELVHAGPASLLQDQRIMRQSWEGAPQSPATGPVIPQLERNAAICDSWQRLSGDAGWGGVVAEALSKPTGKPKWIIYSLAQQEQMLRLLEESIALLPVPAKWNATFSTYYTNLPPEADCFLRCVPAGSDEARAVSPRDCIINLTSPTNLTESSEWIDAARAGRIVGSSQARIASGSQPLDSPQAFMGGRADTVAPSGPFVPPANVAEQAKLPAANYDVHEDWPFKPSEIKGPTLPPPPSVVNNRAGVGAYESSEGSSLKPILFAVTGALLLLLLIGGWFTYTIINKPVATNSKEQEPSPSVEEVTTMTPQEVTESAITVPSPEPVELESETGKRGGLMPEGSPTAPDHPEIESLDVDAQAGTSTGTPDQTHRIDTDAPALNVIPAQAPNTTSKTHNSPPLPMPVATNDPAVTDPLQIAEGNAETVPREEPDTLGPSEVNGKLGESESFQVETVMDGTELFLELEENEEYKLIGAKSWKVGGINEKTQFSWSNAKGSFESFNLDRQTTTSNLLTDMTRIFQLKIGKTDENAMNASLRFEFRLKSQVTPSIRDTDDLTTASKEILLGLNGFTDQFAKLRELNTKNVEYVGKDDDSKNAWIEFKQALDSFVHSEKRRPTLNRELDDGSIELLELLQKIKVKSTPLSQHIEEIEAVIEILQINASKVRENIRTINRLPKIKLGPLFIMNTEANGIIHTVNVSEILAEVTVRIKVDEQGTN